MKFTDEQTELLALLPQELKNSQELTDSARLVLSNIIFLYGMEDAQKNGYVYRSYDDLMKDTFIKSKTSISKAIALLVQKEYIKVKSGRLKDRKANEFTLLDNTLLNEKCTEKCTDKCTVTDYCSNEIKTLQNQVLLLQKQVVLLQKEIEELKKCTDKCTDKCTEKCTDKCTDKCTEKCTEKCTDKCTDKCTEKCTEKCTDKCTDKCTEKCTTDPEPESETKINNKNNNITTGILEHKELGHKVTEDKKENKKEKVNEMKNAVLNEMEREVKNNEIQTSTSSNETNNSNLQIDNKSDRNNSSALADDELFNEIFGITSTGNENKAAGDVETRSMEQLPTNEDKNAPEDLKTQNNAYTLQDWMTEYQKLILQVENTDVEAVQFDTLLDEGCNLFENFPINEGNYKRQMQDLRLWVAKKVNYQKTIKISERWNKYYRAA